MLKEATRSGEQIVAEAKAQAQEEAAKLLESARSQIAAEKESVMRELRREVASLSVLLWITRKGQRA